DGARLILSQRRFTYLREGGAAGQDDAGRLWRVPVTLRASIGGELIERKVLLAEAEEDLPLPAAPDWVVANAGGHGFYRVAYAPVLLDRLTGQLEVLAPIERFGLVSDAFALAQAGDLRAEAFLELTARFRDEADRNVWAVILGALAYVNRALDDEARPALEAFVRDRVRPAAAGLGAPAERGRADAAAPRRPPAGAGRARQRSRDAGAGARALRALPRGQPG